MNSKAFVIATNFLEKWCIIWQKCRGANIFDHDYVHHDGFSNNNAWGLDGHMHSAVVDALGIYALRFPLTPWIFSRYYELWIVKLPKFYAILRLETLSLNCAKLCETIVKVVNQDSSLFVKSLVHAPFMLNLDNLSAVKLLKSQPSWTVLLLTFSRLSLKQH